jgi:uncharacterized protein with GYD domain
MAHYLLEASGSAQMYATLVKNPHDRAEALRPLFEKLGCKLTDYYFAVNQAKHYVILESSEPLDPLIVEAMVISNIANGVANSISITQLLTSAEMVEALKKTSELGYRPPTAS